jgi:aspartate-semialdehyde dehydrogenase
MKIAVAGATGLVGSEMLKVLAVSELSEAEIIPLASEKSIGKEVEFSGKKLKVRGLQDGLREKPDFALFSAGGNTSLEWSPKFAEAGVSVIDNSSAWRMNPSVKLIVPEVNGHLLSGNEGIVANPNCSTIQMVVVLQPLHQSFGLKRVVVSTYQSVTGTGIKGIDQLMMERNGGKPETLAYPHPIDLNLIPHIDQFLENGYTKEEMKMINETRKIMQLDELAITATTVRVPVLGGHSESLNLEFEKPFRLEEVREILAAGAGIILQDNPAENLYPMPVTSKGRDEVFVGRIRRDESVKYGLNLWICADNLRKGAATNAVQIAEWMAKKRGILQA